MIGEFRKGGGEHVDARTSRDVVADDGGVHRVGDRTEVLDEPALGGFVVIRRDQQQRVCAQIFGKHGHLHCRFGGIGACAHYDGQLAFQLFHREFYDGLFLVQGHGGGLSRRAEDDDGVHAACELIVQNAVKAREVHPVGGEWSDECRGSTLEDHFYASEALFMSSWTIWTAFVAAPLRMLSATHQMLTPLSTLSSMRTLPTKTSS